MAPSLALGLTVTVFAAETREPNLSRLTPTLGGVIALQPIAEANELLEWDVGGAQITLKLYAPGTKGMGASLSSSPSIEDGLAGASSWAGASVAGASLLASSLGVSGSIKASQIRASVGV